MAALRWRTVRGMTKAATFELARYKIRVNCICPGVIDTPMRRMGEPQEIAEAALYLASPAAAFVTGADLVVDGGMAL